MLKIGKMQGRDRVAKRAIVLSRTHGHRGSEVSGFVDVSQLTSQRVYKQWCNKRGYEAGCQTCGREKILNKSNRVRVSRLICWRKRT